jgi:dihydropteroate synthase
MVSRPVRASCPLVMGVLNVTPDSFSDGGLHATTDLAVEHGLRMIEEGADLLDVGGESTRPGGGVYGAGAAEVSADDEIARVVPVLTRLRQLSRLPLSVDTRKAAVARRAVDAGATMINDVSLLSDPQLAEVAAEAGALLVLMHSRGDLATMQTGIAFDDVVREVRRELLAAAERAQAAGVARDHILLDPGIGFGKKLEHNLSLLKHAAALRSEGFGVVIGASRKSFIGAITGAPVERRLAGSLAAVAAAALAEADYVRVHDVAETRQFVDVFAAIREAV